MRRIAAHYIVCRENVFRLHYIELDNNGFIKDIYPLKQEIARTEFYDGILFPVLRASDRDAGWVKDCLSQQHLIYPEKDCFGLLELLDLASKEENKIPVDLFRLYGSGLASPEFGADNSCGNCYIERL